MHLDAYGLPVQADGDANDQLQRVGMILVSMSFGDEPGSMEDTTLFYNCAERLDGRLQPKPGIYTRFIGGDPANVSADQLISALAAHVAMGDKKNVLRMFLRMCLRLGFAQNYKDGLNETDRIKIPDFMALRALPLFLRAHRLLYPLAVLSDVLLVFAAASACGPVWRDDEGFSKRDPNDCDDNSIIITLAVCSKRGETPLSWIARKLYAKLRPWNYGCRPYYEAVADYQPVQCHPVFGALRHYHSAQFGGNPEVAELWRPLCKELFE